MEDTLEAGVGVVPWTTLRYYWLLLEAWMALVCTIL